MSERRRGPWPLLALLLGIAAATQLGGSALIYAKAWLAPVLIQHAYARTQSANGPVKPWPWADTWPVARLQATRLGVERIVLEGDSGNTLAFGPGMRPAVRPGEAGLVMLSAHRDTHFRFLRELQIGDTLSLDYTGRPYRYRVVDTRVADARDGHIDAPLPPQGLLLVTCYPFDALVPGGPLRFVVIAEQQGDGTTSL